LRGKEFHMTPGSADGDTADNGANVDNAEKADSP
jgi:hypothetical protein